MNNDINITKFKLYNVQIQSTRIDLSEEAWIEVDESSSQEMPRQFSDFLFSNMFNNYQWGFNRWYRELFDSNTMIGITYSSEQMEVNPFECTDCSYIAIALAILTDNGFVAGIEYSIRTGSLEPVAPYTSTFHGDGNHKVTIRDGDVPKLSVIYKFVYHAFRSSTEDDRKIKLISLFCQCIVRTSSQSIIALKQGFGTPFSGQTGTIIYASIFFEHVFTTSGWIGDVKDGINKHWNISFAHTEIKWEDIKTLQKFRSTLVHDNPLKAQQYINEWKKKHKISDEMLIPTLDKISIQLVKRIMRAIALHYDEYLKYRASLP